MKNNRCIIHIGLPKTGSTSIQYSLFGFSNDHYYYGNKLGYNQGKKLLENENGLTLKELRKTSEGWSHRLFLKTDVLKEHIKCGGDRSLIISSEGIHRLDVDQLTMLHNILYESYGKVEIAGYIRPPLSLFSSSFQQNLRHHSVEIEMKSIPCDYRSRIEKFDDVFGRENVHLWKFDPKSFYEGCVVKDFCMKLRIDFHFEKIIRRNDSLSKELVQLLYYLRTHLNDDSESVLKNHHVGFLKNSEVNHKNKSKFRISPNLLRSQLHFFSEDIQWMENRIGDSLNEETIEEKIGDIRSKEDLLDIDFDKIYHCFQINKYKDNFSSDKERAKYLLNEIHQKTFNLKFRFNTIVKKIINPFVNIDVFKRSVGLK